MATNFASENIKMEIKKEVLGGGGGINYDNGISPPPNSTPIMTTTTTSSSSPSSTSSIFGLSLGLGARLGLGSSPSLNGGSSGITCKVCGKHEYVTNGEFETIKLGDLFPNMSSAALSSPVASTPVAVGLCTNCSKGRSTINPIFQQAAAVIKSERSSTLLHQQQSLMPSMFRSWNSSNNTSTSSAIMTNDRSPLTTTTIISKSASSIQYSPSSSKGRTNSNLSTITSTATSLPVSVLLGNPNPSPKNARKKSPMRPITGNSVPTTTSNITTSHTSGDKTVPVPMALNLNLLASASVLSSEGLVMGKKSSPPKGTPRPKSRPRPRPSSTTPPIRTTTTPAAVTVAAAAAPTAKRNRSRDCSVCNRTFKSAKIAEQHLKRVHNNIGSYCCDICGALFSYRGSLDSHLASHNPPAVTHDCPTCGQKFKEKANLNTHLKLHSDTPKRFKCEFCPSGFSKKVNLKTHLKRKHPDQVMNTDPHHNNSQMQPGQYNNGMGVPMGYPVGAATASTTASSINLPPLASKPDNNSDKPEGNFKCEHCGRAFLFKNNLKAHLRTHTRDRKYTCEICEKSFIYKESLKNHMLLHSNEVPYQCDICLKRFRDRSNRRKHVKNVHKYMFINGDSSSLAPIGSRSVTDPLGPSSSSSMQQSATFSGTPSVTPPAKKTRRKNNKNTSSTTPTGDPSQTAVKTPKRNRKKAGNGVGSSAGAAGSNNSVIVSNASASSDHERKIIMSPGPKMMTAGDQQQQQQQSLEYNLHQQNLPVTVHVPSSSSLFGRNVIVKATGASSVSSVPLPQFSDPYNRDSSSTSVPMQQNVIVYPKPKHSFLETYSGGESMNQSSSVISQHLSQYYSSPTSVHQGGQVQGQGSLPIGVAYPEQQNASYSQLLVQSPRSATPNQGNNTFDSYVNVMAPNRRGSSGSGTSKSPPGLVGVPQPQYSSSPAPVFSSQGGMGPIKTEPQQQPYFWPSMDNMDQSVTHGHGSPFSAYNSPQNSSASTPTPNNQICGDNGVNVLNVNSYSQSPESMVGGMDPSAAVQVTGTAISAGQNTATSTNPNSFYYKDFDFSYL